MQVHQGQLRRFGWLVAIVASVALVAAACTEDGDGGGEPADDAMGTATASSSQDGDAADASGEMEVDIVMQDNYFEPDTLSVPAGTKVTFRYENAGQAVHNIVVQAADTEGEDYQSPTIVNPGESGEFEGTFTTPGEIKFICVYHLPDMTGTLNVE